LADINRAQFRRDERAITRSEERSRRTCASRSRFAAAGSGTMSRSRVVRMCPQALTAMPPTTT